MFDNMCIGIDHARHENSPVPIGQVLVQLFCDLLHDKKWLPRQLISSALHS
jgi:hypothetical protein